MFMQNSAEARTGEQWPTSLKLDDDGDTKSITNFMKRNADVCMPLVSGGVCQYKFWRCLLC